MSVILFGDFRLKCGNLTKLECNIRNNFEFTTLVKKY